MKNILFIILFSIAFAKCDKKSELAENEYEITGTVDDKSLDGKNVILEKRGGFTGFVPVDTVKVENGKFVFRGTATDPELRFITIEGIKDQKINMILENGDIEVDINKDTLYSSVVSGSYNNEKLYEYYKMSKAENAKIKAFEDENTDAIKAARQSNDTATIERLTNGYKGIKEGYKKSNMDFVKNNPDAYINVFIIKDLASKGAIDQTETKELYNGLNEKLKTTTEGKEIADVIAKMEENERRKAAVSAGKKAPDFAAPNPEGKTVSLKDAMGKVTVIDFWASWCRPCRAENPKVVAMYNELHSKGLNIIGVSLDKSDQAWKKAITDDKLTWTHISNLKSWEEPIAKQYGVQSIPATFVLDENGVIVARDLRGSELKAKVEELLAK